MTSDFAEPSEDFLRRRRPGSRVAGYLIERQIGQGGMAVVFRAQDELLGRWVALKVIAPALARDESFRARFLRESRAVASFNEPHIIPVYAAGETEGMLYMVTPFIEGGDLAKILLDSGGVLAPTRAAELIGQVASALDAAHAAGFVHRDVKPGNILIETLPGRPEKAYLSDFGISKHVLSATSLTVSGQFIGTPEYSAPEQFKGNRLDGRADQYALACVAFQLLVGALPFHRDDAPAIMYAHLEEPAPSLAAIRPSLPSAVDAVVARALEKSPANRYPSCGEFAAALRDALSSPAQANSAAAVASAERVSAERVSAERVSAERAAAAAGVGPAYYPTRTRAGGAAPNEAASGEASPAPAAGADARTGWSRNRRRVALGAVGAIVIAAGVVTALALPGSRGIGGGGTGGGGTPPPPLHHGKPFLAARFTVPDKGLITNVRFSPDGKLMAAADEYDASSRIYVWDAATRTYRTTLAVPNIKDGSLTYSPTVENFAFSADGSSLTAIVTAAGTLVATPVDTPIVMDRWNLSTGKETTVSSASFPLAYNPVISADDSTIVNSCETAGQSLNVQKTDNGSAVVSIEFPAVTSVCTTSLDSTGNAVLIDILGATESTIYAWDVVNDKASLKLRYSIKGVGNYSAISPDGKLAIIAAGRDETLLDVAVASNVTPADPRWRLDYLDVFSDDSRVIAGLGADGKVDLWEAGTRAHLTSFTVPAAAASPIYSSGGLAVGVDDSEVAILGMVVDRWASQISLWSIPQS